MSTISFSPRLKELWALENERHNLNRKIRKIMNTSAYVLEGRGTSLVNEWCLRKGQVTARIHRIKSQMMGAK